MKPVEEFFEKSLFVSRWLLAPFFVGLVLATFLLLAKFIGEFIHLVSVFTTLDEAAIILGVLTLIDITLLANLIFIIVFSGYESFVSKIEVADHEDKPGWMGKVGFSSLKVKLMSSIVAISAIDLLRVFIRIDLYDYEQIKWKVIIHALFVGSGLVFAYMDYLSSRN